jgi:hypothetical protein
MKLIVVVAVAMLTCGGNPSTTPTPLNGPTVEGARPIVPLPRFLSEFRAAAECNGLRGRYEPIVWYVVPGASFRNPYSEQHEWLLGLWVGPDTIYVAEMSLNGYVPKHEMIHYLRQDSIHVTEQFGEACHAMVGYLVSDDPNYRP